MNNFQKNIAIIDLKDQVFGHDIIFIKDHLLYLPGSKILTSMERPVATTYLSSGLEIEHAVEESQPVKINAGKTSFLVFKNQKYTTVKTENIAFFFIRNEVVHMMCFDQQEYTLNQSLDQIMNSVPTSLFFRVNRKYLINFRAIKEVEHYFQRKLFVRLQMETPDKLLINKEKSNTFLSWMGDR